MFAFLKGKDKKKTCTWFLFFTLDAWIKQVFVHVVFKVCGLKQTGFCVKTKEFQCAIDESNTIGVFLDQHSLLLVVIIIFTEHKTCVIF